MGYDSAGTVEFIVDDETGEHFFLEVNTRLQVEHPVTEMITGLDLVEIMIRVAAGERLPLDPAMLGFEGHAIEARILAEDTANGFAPQIGTIHQLVVPDGVRWDSAIEAGSEITPHYDSMIAKLIVHGTTRELALDKMRRALEALIIDGPATTAGLHRWLLDQPPIAQGRVTTRFLDENPAPNQGPTRQDPDVGDDDRADTADRSGLAAGRAWFEAADAAAPKTSPWINSTFTVTPGQGFRSVDLDNALRPGGVSLGRYVDIEDLPELPSAVDLAARRVAVNDAGYTYNFTVPTLTEKWAAEKSARSGSGDALVAPFPAVVSEVGVAPGDSVDGDQVLVVIEAMKMLHSLRSSGIATIAEVRVAPGDQIATGDVLVTFAQPSTDVKPNS